MTLLSNFLEALSISNIIPKRFLLQTGGKHYALHLGPTTIPMTEDTPAERVDHKNFYFPQEDLLSAWSIKHSTHWTITRPGFIIGANPTAAISLSYGLALYASIQKNSAKNSSSHPTSELGISIKISLPHPSLAISQNGQH